MKGILLHMASAKSALSNTPSSIASEHQLAEFLCARYF